MSRSDIGAKLKNTVHISMSRCGVGSVVLGLSGGADSVALALLLKEAEVELHCVHCNFHLRGQESDRDMEFVVGFCAENNLPIQVIHFDTEGYCEREGVSL